MCCQQGGGERREEETGDSGRHRLMLSLLLSLDRKFAMASLTTCNEQGRQKETQTEAEESEPQAATSRHLKIMLQTFWHVAQVRVSEIGPCKRFNSPATRCDARRLSCALRLHFIRLAAAATTNWRSRFSCTTCKFIATVALCPVAEPLPQTRFPPLPAIVTATLFGLLCICICICIHNHKARLQTEERAA